MSLSLPQRLPLAACNPNSGKAGRAISVAEGAPILGVRVPSGIAGLAREGRAAWRVVQGSMGLPNLIVPVVGEIIP